MDDRDESFERFCAEAYPRLVSALTHSCGDRFLAEELAEDALVAACRRWPKVSRLESPFDWTYRVGANRASSWWWRQRAARRARKRAADVDHDPDGSLRETAPPPTRPVDASAIVRRAHRERVARRTVASTVVVLAVLVGAATLITGLSGDEVRFEPAPPEPDPRVPSPDPPADPEPEPTVEPDPRVPSPDPPADPEPEPPAPPTAEPDPPEPPETQESTMTAPDSAPDVITEAHDGSTFALRRGDARPLRLSNDWLWDPPELSGEAVELAPVDYLVDPGYVEWEVNAVAAGTSEVTVAGRANCGDPAACPARTVTLRFQVEG